MDALKKVEGKDLRMLVEALQERKENHWTAMGGRRTPSYIVKRGATKKSEEIEDAQQHDDEAKKRRRMGRFPLR